MTFNNSILLIVKQDGGIDYNELFTRISSRYKNRASAHSALSRSLKNLVSFGLIKNEKNQYFITDKGIASISIEMKEKLVIKLNRDMKKPLNNLEEIVQLLIVLSQRSNLDKDLLVNAKENASFTISDVEELRKKISNKRSSLKKMDSLLKIQEEKLKDLNFNDSKEQVFDKALVEKIVLAANDQKIVAEINDEDILKQIPLQWKKGDDIIVHGADTKEFFDILLENNLVEANLFIPKIKIKLRRGKAKLYSSYKTLQSFG